MEISVEDAHSLAWANAEGTLLFGKVKFSHRPTYDPFSAPVPSVEDHHIAFVEAALAGEFGGISPFVPPSDDDLRAALPDLEKWRVDSIIDLTAGLRDQINAAIDALEEPARTVSRNKLQSVAMFSRVDPLFSTIGAAVGMTEQEIDTLWVATAAL